MKRAKKSLSQNFIIDKNICKKIIKLTKIHNRNVIEIGPGYGSLTNFIIEKKPNKLWLIEKDNNIYLELIKKYKNNKNIKIFNQDATNFDFTKLKNIIIISNLPYNQSSKIILNLFKYSKNISEMILMIQKEVSLKYDYNLKKINKYKFLTKIISEYYRCFDVSPTVFLPKPKVNSSVVKFIFKNIEIDWVKAELFVRKIFNNKRKILNKKIESESLVFIKNKNKRADDILIDELLELYYSF